MPELIPDYYALLGVARTASEDEIRRAYRRLARLAHPDVAASAGVFPDIRLVNEAWEVLGDPASRAVYDRATNPGEFDESDDGLFWAPPNVPRVPEGFGRAPRPRAWSGGFGGTGYSLLQRLADTRRSAASLYAHSADLSNLSQLGDDELWLLELQKLPVHDSDLRALSRFRSLEMLFLDDCPIGDAGLEWLRSLPALHTLSLTACNVTDGGVATLRAIESLATLELDETGISDDGLKMLEGHPSLTVLDIRRTKVKGEGIQHLRDLPALRELRVTGSADRAARKVFRDRPEVTIE